MLYVSPKDICAFTADGLHSYCLEADVPTEVPDHMVPGLVTQGARPYEGKVLSAPVVVDQERVAALVAASRTILAENNPESLTTEGTVKVAVLNAAVGFNSTKAERDAADAILEG